MRRLNGRNALILSVIIIVGVLVIESIHRLQVQKTVTHLLAQAKRAEAAGEYPQALTWLDTYLEKKPNDIEGRALAASIALQERSLFQQGGINRAITSVEKLFQLTPSRHETRLQLVRILLEAGIYAEARSHLDFLTTALPNDGRVGYYRGWLEERNGRFALAVTHYEQARLNSPHLLEIYDHLARVYRVRLNDREKADATMDLPKPLNGLIHHNTNNAKAYLARALYRRAFKIPNVDQDIAKALELDPNSLDVLICAAREATIGNQIDKSRQYLKRAEELFPKNAQVYLAAGAVETRVGQFDVALDVLRRGHRELPNDLEIQWNFADLLVQLGRVSEAEAEISRFQKMGINRDLTDFLSALMLLGRQRWAEAAPALERSAKVLGSKPETNSLARRAYLGLGRCYAELGNTDLQLTSFRRALSYDYAIDDRQTIIARSGVAAALVDMGRIEDAIEEYRKNLIVPGAPPDTKIILARLLIFKNLRVLENYRRWSEIEELLDASSKSVPDSSEVTILRAEALAAQQKLDPARQLLEKARNDNPERPDVWVALSILYQRQDRPQEAVQTLEEAEKKLGDKIELRLAHARIWATQGGPKAFENLAKLQENIDHFPPTKRRELLKGIAQAYAQLADLKTSLALWKRLGDEQPHDLTPRLVQFDIAMMNGDRIEVDRVVNEIRKIEGEEGSIWRYAKAKMLIEEFRSTSSRDLLTQARDLLNLVAQRRPFWSRIPLAQGEIEDSQGFPNVALRGYLKAITLGDRSPVAIRRSIQILYQQRKYDYANQILRSLQEQLPISDELQRLAADISLQTRDYSRALSLAKKAVTSESPDYKDHIWLGELLWIIGQRAATEGRLAEAETHKTEAQEELLRAVQLGPDKADAWVALIQFLGRIDNRVDAEKYLIEAEKAIPAEEAPLALAQANEALGHSERVETLYRKALEQKPNDSVVIQALANHLIKTERMDEARPLLERLIELRRESGTATTDEAAWAKRILGIVLANEGNYRQSIKALEMLGLADAQVDDEKLANEAIDDLRAKARVLARQKTVTKRREAKRFFEEIFRREPPIPDDLFHSARLHESEGNWTKARDQYQRAISLFPKEPSYITEFALALLRHNLPDDAQIWLKQLQTLKPGSPEAIEIQARILKARGQEEQAAALILDYVKDKEIRLRVSANLLEELGQYKAAEDLFRRLAQLQGQPENVLLLASFLGRRQRTVDALDLCDRAWSTCRPEDVAERSIQIVYFSDSTESYYSRVAEQLERMIKLNPKSVGLVFELANVRGLQGRIEDAKAIYLQAFDRTPQNAAPLNNLAWLLAYQNGQAKEALQYINRAIEIAGPIPALLDTRAIVQMALNEPELAIRDLEEAISVESTVGRQLHLAEAYLLAQRRKDAEESLREARRMGLQAASLHPFERKPYQDLVAKLAKGKGEVKK